jgi:pyridoxine kinase
MQRHVLSMSSQVAFGPVGNSAAVPALQAADFTVLQVPTIILSNHPGLGKPSGVRLPAIEIEAMLAATDRLGALVNCIGVLTGYFASADQVEIAASRIAIMKQANPSLFVLVDPVIGDGDSLYVAKDVAMAIRDQLLPLADCITPNRFELSWLTDKPIANRQDAIDAAAQLTCAEMLATSIPVNDKTIATLAITKGDCAETLSTLRPSVPHGTGDFLAGLYLAARLNGYEPAQALKLSSALLEAAIIRSEGQPSLDIIGALHDH